MYKVMFVCLGNVCRSPLAHILMENYLHKNGLTDKISVESSGVNVFNEGQAMCENIIAAAAGRGISMKHSSRRFYKEDGLEFDLILAMDNTTMSRIKGHLKGTNPIGKLRYFRYYDPVKSGGNEVPDPWDGGKSETESVYNMIERTMKPLVDSIVKKEISDE